NGCPKLIATTPVTILPPPSGASAQLLAGSTTCVQGETQFEIVGGNTDYSYQWTGPDNFSYTGQDTVITISNLSLASEGYYYVTITDSNGCSMLDSVQLNVDTLPSVTATANQTKYCPGDTVQLSGSNGISFN